MKEGDETIYDEALLLLGSAVVALKTSGQPVNEKTLTFILMTRMGAAPASKRRAYRMAEKILMFSS
ncbi:hypothetical protein [Kosakonia sp. S42]|uniref:hypothetical protein n=1 Tax=Kosakonia sp. S42 TaxID=2767458 RepID=UPI00190E4C7B|nr:hypothetical protein [Kosakonia sp. S42]MBK0018888.1 hypothetical protein [Kosakonia sp. S42]